MKALLFRSRTIWGALLAALATIGPDLVANMPVIHQLADAWNAPAWVKPALQLAGVALVVYARWDDARRGVNPA